MDWWIVSIGPGYRSTDPFLSSLTRSKRSKLPIPRRHRGIVFHRYRSKSVFFIYCMYVDIKKNLVTWFGSALAAFIHICL